MIVFWLIAVVMFVGALVVFMRPMFRKPVVDTVSREEINIALYRQRLEELKLEHENGAIDDDQYQQAVHELERGLLQDVPAVSRQTKTQAEGETKKTVAIAVGIGFLLLATGLYWLLGDIHYLSPASKAEHLQQQQHDLITASISKIRKHLKANPGDAQTWAMLGRSYFLLGQYKQAVSSYEQAYRLTGGRHPQLLVDYAESLARASGDRLQGLPTELVMRALKLDAKNQSALWLAGFAAFQQKQYRQALVYWRRLYRLQQQAGRIDPTLYKYLAQALRLAGDIGSTGRVLTVKVSLSRALRRQVRNTDTVFIFARAVKGPRMPVAVVRKQAGDLPLTVKLDDSMAMQAGMGISNFRRVTIEARISRTGEAIAQKGDFYGRSKPINVNRRQPVVIVIRDRIK